MDGWNTASLVNLNQVATNKGTIVNINPVYVFYSSFHYRNTVVKLGSFEHLDLFDSCFWPKANQEAQGLSVNAFYEASLFGGKNGSWQWLYIQSCWGNFHDYMEVGIGTNLENFQGFSSWLQGWWKFVENQNVPSPSSTRQGVWGGVLRVIEGPHNSSFWSISVWQKADMLLFSQKDGGNQKSQNPHCSGTTWSYNHILSISIQFLLLIWWIHQSLACC